MTSNRVDQINVSNGLQDHERRIRILEANPIVGLGGGGSCGPWYYVGTLVQVGSDVDKYGTLISTLIGTNPGGIIIPFLNGWNNSLGEDAPVSFMLDSCMVVLRGGAFGGANNTAVFQLPTGFTPYYAQPLVSPTGGLDDAFSTVAPDGTVTFLSQA